MWKFVTRGVRESFERRACRTNVYSQNTQDSNGNNNEQNKVTLCDKKFISPCLRVFYHGHCRNAKHVGPKDKENDNKYDAKYSWTDAVGLSSILAVGYVVCQSLCIRRKIFEIDNTNFDKWRTKIISNSHLQVYRLFSSFLLPHPKSILPVSQKSFNNPKQESEDLVDGIFKVEQPYGPLTAEETLKEAINEFTITHEAVMGELELNCGTTALEEKRYEDAIEHFTEGAKMSSVGSIFNLALCYELGLGTSVDQIKAAEYYKIAADKGHVDAMYNLGVFHAQGKGGLKINFNTAKQLFSEAAEKGHVQALKALELEKSFKKQSKIQKNIPASSKNQLDIKTSYNSMQNHTSNAKLMNYNVLTDFNDQIIKSDQLLNTYDENIHSVSPTEMFLNMLGVQERSAMPLISVGESGL